MYRVLSSVLFAATLIGFTLIGCQSNPTSPTTQAPPSATPQSEEPPAQSHYCLGLYSVVIDSGSGEVRMLPARSGEWHFNLTGVLNKTMGISVALVPGESDPPNGLFALDITLVHPFATKPQFAGFDVKGILITPGTLNADSLVFADVDETRLENADGYTRWWNPTEFTQSGILGYTQGSLTIGPTSALTVTVNPYKLFADILGPVSTLALVGDEPLDNPQGRAVFTPGSSNTRRYLIRFPMDPGPQVIYGYAIDCAWDIPVPNPPEEIPDDFPIEANQPEAYRVVISPLADTLYYDSESGVGGGVLRLQMNVHDWQGQSAGDVPSEVSAVEIYAPDLMSGGVSATFLNETPVKARYTADLTGVAVPDQAGETLLICRVESSDGSYQQTPAPAPDEPISAFQTLVLDIPDPECVGDANNDWLEAAEIGFGSPVENQVCLPDDYKDFFYFEIPAGFEPTGDIRLYCDAEPTELGLYDRTEALLAKANVSSGEATISFEGLHLLPGQYFIRVLTSNDTQVAPYFLELAGELLNVIPSDPVEVTPSTLYVDPNRVWIHDDYAFLTAYGVWVYDISDPSDPVQLAHEWMHVTEDSCFRYPYLYFTERIMVGDSQLNMISFVDPTSPVLHEDLIHYSYDLAGMEINSTHLYVGTHVQPDSEVLIYEYATDPLNPSEVGSVTVPYEPQIVRLMDAEGPDTRLIVGTWDDIFSFSVEDPGSITPTGSYNFASGAPRDITVHENYIYAGCDVTAGGDGWLYVFLQGPGSLFLSGTLDTPGTGRFVTADWPYVYMGDGDSGLTICDVTTASSPSYVSSAPLVSSGCHLAVEDDIVYIIPNDAGLQVFDVSTPVTPVSLARLRVLNSAFDFVEKDGYLIVAEIGSGGYGAIKTIDISDPANASVVGEYFTSVHPSILSLSGNVLAATGNTKEWVLLDATDPLNLTPYSSTPETDFVYALGLRGDAIYVYVNKVGYPVYMYDISDPYAPSFKGGLLLSAGVGDFQFVGDFMYVITGPSVEIYSIVDPFAPSFVDSYSYSTSGYREAQIRGDYMYLVSDDILEIADISTPSSPTYVGSELLPVASFGYDEIAVEGQFGYVGGHSETPVSCWVFPPDNPSVLGPLYEGLAHGARDLLALNGYLYEGSEGTGLHIFDLY